MNRGWVRVMLISTALMIGTSIAVANPYDKCMLDHAASTKEASPDGVDVIVEACIKSAEEALDSEEGAKVRVNFLYGELVRGLGELGLILQVYNGSSYDITSITVGLTDKATKTQRLYRRELWYSYNRGPGIVSSYGPRYKNRFIKSLTSGEYMFPIGVLDVTQAELFKRYDVVAVSALGVRH